MKAESPYAYRDQSLADHMNGCLILVEKFLEINRNYVHVTYSRLLKAGLDIPGEEPVRNTIILGSVLHDLGKAYRYYQERLEKYGGGFEKHEILSAVSCYKVLCTKPLSQDQKLDILLLMSILNHHQAFRESVPELLTGGTRLLENVIRIAKTEPCENISNLNPVLGKIGLTVNDVFARDYIEFNSLLGDIKGILNSFLKYRFDENRRWIKLYSLIMFPLLLVDNLDACQKRGGDQSRSFINEIIKVMEDV